MLQLATRKWQALKNSFRRFGKAFVHRLGLVTRGQAAELQQALWTQAGELTKLQATLQHLSGTVQRLDVPNETAPHLASLNERINQEAASRATEVDALQRNLQALDGAVRDSFAVETLVAEQVAHLREEQLVRLAALEERVSTAMATLAGELAALKQQVIERDSARAADLAALNENLQTLTQSVQHLPAVEERVGQGERLAQDQALALGRLAEEACATKKQLELLRDGPVYQVTQRLMQTLEWLVDQPWRTSPAPADGPLVSIIMAARDRADCIATAIESVQRQTYAHWELLVIDDGSSDDTAARVEAVAAADDRIRCLREPARGVSAARNRGLEAARGAIIAYLDSDNVMAPGYLLEVAAAFVAHPEAAALYAAQVIQPGDGTAPRWVRYQRFDRAALERDNYIDLNIFAHRRELVESAGGFDEAMTRVVDYDLILRYTERQPPLALATVGGTYFDAPRTDRITIREGLGLNHHVLRRRMERPLQPGLRVLYSVWHWPQVTESYVRWEAEYMRRRGVEVLMCPELSEIACWFECDFPVTHEPLERAIQQFRPHLIHAHWLGHAREFAPLATRHGVPLTVRAHGFEMNPEVIGALQAEPSIRSIYLHPHWPPQFSDRSKLRAVPTGFAPHLYYPGPKERRLVFRTSAALPSKEGKLFIDVAAACPEFEFVLAVAPALRHEAYVAELVEYNRSRNNPVRLLVGLPHEEVASWMRRAGIYLHTIDPASKIGGPISLVEAMATGCHVIARRLDPLVEMIGPLGGYYTSVAEAAERLRETLRWTAADWAEVERGFVDRAYLRHGEAAAYAAILDDWLAITGHGFAKRLAA